MYILLGIHCIRIKLYYMVVDQFGFFLKPTKQDTGMSKPQELGSVRP